VLTSGIESHRRRGASDWRLEQVRGSGDRVAVAYSWRAPDGSRARWAQVLRLREGKIVGMRDYADPARALRAVPA
jgi:ketosteroid isomerase-like protein